MEFCYAYHWSHLRLSLACGQFKINAGQTVYDKSDSRTPNSRFKFQGLSLFVLQNKVYRYSMLYPMERKFVRIKLQGLKTYRLPQI